MTHFEKLSFFSGGNPVFLTQVISRQQENADAKVVSWISHSQISLV